MNVYNNQTSWMFFFSSSIFESLSFAFIFSSRIIIDLEIDDNFVFVFIKSFSSMIEDLLNAIDCRDSYEWLTMWLTSFFKSLLWMLFALVARIENCIIKISINHCFSSTLNIKWQLWWININEKTIVSRSKSITYSDYHNWNYTHATDFKNSS